VGLGMENEADVDVRLELRECVDSSIEWGRIARRAESGERDRERRTKAKSVQQFSVTSKDHAKRPRGKL
jgi:hypothetical protein